MAKLIYLLLTLIPALLMATHTNSMSCSDAVNALIPCGSYLLGASGANPSSECCSSAQALNKMAATVKSRHDLCECLKTTGPSFGVVPARAKHLPPFCKLKLNIPVSPTVDCNSIIRKRY